MISVADLFSRVPDLQRDYEDVGGDLRYARVRELTVKKEGGRSDGGEQGTISAVRFRL